MKRYIVMLLIIAQHYCMLHAINSHILHQTTMAHYSVAKKDYGTAKNRYQTLFYTQKHDCVPVHAYRGYLMYLHDTARYQEIVSLIPKVEASYANDPDILFLMAQALAHVGKTTESSQRIIELSTRFKDNPEIIFSAAQIYVNNKEPRNALKIIDLLLNTPPHRPSDRIFNLLKAQIHAQLNENKEAIDTIQTCLELYPTFDQGWLFFAMLQEYKDSLDLAIKGYTNFLEFTDKPNKEIEQHLLRLALQKSMREQKNKTAITASHSCLEVAMKRFGNKEYAAALEALDNCLKENPTNVDGRIMKIQVLSSMNRLQDALQLVSQWIQENPSTALWFQTMHMLCRTGLSYNQAYSTTKTIAQQHPNTLLTQLYLAEYATRMHDHQQAIQHCQHALQLTNDNQLKASLYFHIGMMHYHDGALDKAITILEQGLPHADAYAPLHNLLAYCCILHTHDTARAAAYSKKALSIEPSNPHYWDTQAVILYEGQQYGPALELLEKAHKQLPHDALVLEHLAKTLYKQGNKARAYQSIEQAQSHAQLQSDKDRIAHLYQSWKTAEHAPK